MKLDKEWYTIEEAMELFGVARSTIYDWINRRGLKWVQVGGRRRITRQAIEEFLASGSDQGGDQGYNPKDIRTPMSAAALEFAG